ncbi:MAG: hypothetical protein ACO3UZ_00995 [Burkholderiaceae bacterium]
MALEGASEPQGLVDTQAMLDMPFCARCMGLELPDLFRWRKQKRAALACGGELRLVSSSGEGTLFRCVLPAGR